LRAERWRAEIERPASGKLEVSKRNRIHPLKVACDVVDSSRCRSDPERHHTSWHELLFRISGDVARERSREERGNPSLPVEHTAAIERDNGTRAVEQILQLAVAHACPHDALRRLAGGRVQVRAVGRSRRAHESEAARLRDLPYSRRRAVRVQVHDVKRCKEFIHLVQRNVATVRRKVIARSGSQIDQQARVAPISRRNPEAGDVDERQPAAVGREPRPKDRPELHELNWWPLGASSFRIEPQFP
jgi:hypothetical protein